MSNRSPSEKKHASFFTHINDEVSEKQSIDEEKNKMRHVEKVDLLQPAEIDFLHN